MLTWRFGPSRPVRPGMRATVLGAFLGVARAGAPFRVFALTAPARLVIDVQR